MSLIWSHQLKIKVSTGMHSFSRIKGGICFLAHAGVSNIQSRVVTGRKSSFPCWLLVRVSLSFQRPLHLLPRGFFHLQNQQQRVKSLPCFESLLPLLPLAFSQHRQERFFLFQYSLDQIGHIHIITDNLPISRLTTLITPTKSLLLCKLTYSQVLEVRKRGHLFGRPLFGLPDRGVGKCQKQTLKSIIFKEGGSYKLKFPSIPSHIVPSNGTQVAQWEAPNAYIFDYKE